MKKVLLLFFCTVSVLVTVCCNDDDAESAADCLNEASFLNVNHSVNSENPMIVDFSVAYIGVYSLYHSVKCDVADSMSVLSFNGSTVYHTFSSSGTYTVKDKISLNNGRCSFEITETVNLKLLQFGFFCTQRDGMLP